MNVSSISILRKQYHAELLKEILTTKDGIPSNADKSSRVSIAIANEIGRYLNSSAGEKVAGQTAGNEFESINARFIELAFSELKHLRPGDWEVKKVGGRNRTAIADYEQYAHLIALESAAKKDPELAAALGNDYTISPDIVISRAPVSDQEINVEGRFIVDHGIAQRTSLRAVNGGKRILHASISSKWTIRSDRSQNSRSEALNLIRNRKGHLPHMVVVAGEPLPSRLASIALGTGDIDCVYHFALYELVQAVERVGNDDNKEMLKIMIDGKRLKDISDLPFDLAI